MSTPTGGVTSGGDYDADVEADAEADAEAEVDYGGGFPDDATPGHGNGGCITQSELDAAFEEVIRPQYTDINEHNLVVPIDGQTLNTWRAMRQQRLALARRVLVGVYYEICRSGLMGGTVPAPLMADWVWGPGKKPKHWRSQLTLALARVAKETRAEDGTGTIALSLDERQVVYQADPAFLGSLAGMVEGGRLRLLRGVDVNRKVTAEDIDRLRQRLGSSAEHASDRELRREIAGKAREFAARPSLSNLGREGSIRMIFVPALLGVRAICRRIGLAALALARNLTRSYKVEGAAVPAFSGERKLACPLLDPETTYAAFAANGGGGNGRGRAAGRKGRGYLLARWLVFHELREGGEKKLLNKWAEAAGPLRLTVVGIGRDNTFYSLDDMLAATPAALEKLHVRIYTPAGWQQAWTRVFGMTPGGAGGEEAAADGPAKRGPPAVGDLPEVEALVREAGVRATARAIGLDPGNLSRYINHGTGLTAAQVAALREHLSATRPLGGPDIADEFATLVEEHPGNLGWALAYRRLLRWPVVPLKAGTREGHVRWKPYQTCLPTEAEIRRWWDWWPEASIGLILGPLSGVFALDVDSEAAQEALLDLMGGGLPDCPRQLSGSYSEERPWKRHYLFCHPADAATRAKWEPLVKGLEFRGNKGLLILAPSAHKSGTGKYAWEDGYAIWQRALPAVPDPVRQLLLDAADGRSAPAQPPPPPPPAAPGSLKGKPRPLRYKYKRRSFSDRTCAFLARMVDHGERNDRLFDAAKEMRDYGVPEVVALTRLVPAGQGLGLDEAEILNTVSSAYSRPPTPRRVAGRNAV